MALKEPVGVILGIAPWNASIILGVRAIAVPLACGNSVILKASELCPRTHALIIEAFAEAGFPEGVVTLLACGDERYHRVDPGRHALLLSVVRIVPAPQLAAAGCNQQEQAVAVGELVSLIPRLCCSYFCIVQQGSSPIPRFSKPMPRAEPTPLPEACGRPWPS